MPKQTSAAGVGIDKLHNALAILRDLENPNVGVAVFKRFTGEMEGTLG